MDVFLQRQQNLHGIDRFEQIVVNLASDGLVHQVLSLVFGDHHHGNVGMEVFDGCQGFQSGESGHILVEEDEVEVFVAAKFNGVTAVRGCRHFVSAFLQEDTVCFEQVDFVVDP